jgi:hypothetical protein
VLDFRYYQNTMCVGKAEFIEFVTNYTDFTDLFPKYHSLNNFEHHSYITTMANTNCL